MLKYNKKGEGPSPTGGEGKTSLNKMKTYKPFDWQNYKPNMVLAKAAAGDIAVQLSSGLKSPLKVSTITYNEKTRIYNALFFADIVQTGVLMRLTELGGHYFKANCHFVNQSRFFIVELEEIDWGHFHRFSHFINKIDDVCDECPDEVRFPYGEVA